MNIAPVGLNRRLAESVKSRIAAEEFFIAGQTAFWRLVGVGLIAFGFGCAVGTAFYGYSYVARNSENISVLASTFSKALSQVQLHAAAEGTVTIEPKELSLAKDQVISLDPDSRVLLDPSARVLADGELQVHVPSVSIPRVSKQQGSSGVPTITNFEVFKSVPFDKRSVMTGWAFLTSTQRAPTYQHCYYTQSAETPEINIDLGIGYNGEREKPKTKPKDFDLEAAFDKCVWFKGEYP